MDELAKLRAEKRDLTRQHAAIIRQLRPLQKEAERLYDERHQVIEKISALLIAGMGDAPDWPLLLDARQDGYALHKRFGELIYERGGWHDGMWPDTRQRAVKLMLTKGDPASLHKTHDLIEELLPHYRPHADGLVWFGIFDSDLGARGVWDLRVQSVDPGVAKALIHRTYYGRETVEREGTLGEMIEHIQETLWYSRADGKEEDDDG